MADLLTIEDFQPALEDAFAVRLTDAEVTLTLVEVRPLGAESGNARAPFALLFRGPDDLQLPQATYPLAHPRLGAQDIFLVPVAPAQYEAIFT